MAQRETGSDRIQTATENMVDAANLLSQRIRELSNEFDNVRYVVEFLRPWEDSKRRVRLTSEARSSDPTTA